MTPLRITWGRPAHSHRRRDRQLKPRGEQGSYRCSRATSSTALDAPGQPSEQIPQDQDERFRAVEVEGPRQSSASAALASLYRREMLGRDPTLASLRSRRWLSRRPGTRYSASQRLAFLCVPSGQGMSRRARRRP